MLVSIPFSGEKRALKLTQMHPKDGKNKEHKDHDLKKNFLSFLSLSFFFFFVCQCSDFALINAFECCRLANRGQSG